MTETIDVTNDLLKELAYAPGDLAKAARKTVPAKKIQGTLVDTMNLLSGSSFDPTMGYVHLPVLYSCLFRYLPRSTHMNVIRLLKGGFLAIMKHYNVPKLIGSRAADNEFPESPYWYELVIGDRASTG